MKHEYMTTCGWDQSYYARVPFYWSTAHLWQRALQCAEGALFMIIPGVVYLFGITFFACSIPISAWFIIPTVILSLVAIIQIACLIKIRTMDWISSQDDTKLRINSYRRLPRKIRRKLRPAARYIHKNSSDLTQAEIDDWRKIVDGYSRLNPYTPKPVAANRGRIKIEKEAQKIHKLIVQDDIQRAKIEQQRKIEREMQIEVREKTKKYCEENGLEYIELDV